jgi:hypothetical protein
MPPRRTLLAALRVLVVEPRECGREWTSWYERDEMDDAVELSGSRPGRIGVGCASGGPYGRPCCICCWGPYGMGGAYGMGMPCGMGIMDIMLCCCCGGTPMSGGYQPCPAGGIIPIICCMVAAPPICPAICCHGGP